MRRYLPDFIVLVDDGNPEPLQLIVEIKGYRAEDAKEKKAAAETYWIPGVNNLRSYGRWAFAEFTQVFEIESAFNALLAEACKHADTQQRRQRHDEVMVGLQDKLRTGGDTVTRDEMNER